MLDHGAVDEAGLRFATPTGAGEVRVVWAEIEGVDPGAISFQLGIHFGVDLINRFGRSYTSRDNRLVADHDHQETRSIGETDGLGCERENNEIPR